MLRINKTNDYDVQCQIVQLLKYKILFLTIQVCSYKAERKMSKYLSFKMKGTLKITAGIKYKGKNTHPHSITCDS